MSKAETNSEKRNLQVQTFISQCLAIRKKQDFESINADIVSMIANIIHCEALGFRGIVITSFAGKFLDSTFDPTKDFYSCNPRSIFEKGIRLALLENNIPCGKSDPLNVAKAIKQINLEWAKGKRPMSVAQDVVNLLEYLFVKKTTKAEFQKIQAYFFLELSKQKIVATQIDMPERLDANSIKVANLLIEFMTAYPDGGATPQFFCGEILHLSFEDDPNLHVGGLDADVNATNTTSKKPGDIWIENSKGKLEKIYEITLKSVDNNRIEDCVQNLKRLKIAPSLEITFLCRIPEDTSSLTFEANANLMASRNHLFLFLDIRNFFYYGFIALTKEKQQKFIMDTQKFMNELKRKKAVRDAWKLLVSQL